MHSESLHTKLGMLLATCSNESYPVDYLRGKLHAGARACSRRKRPALCVRGLLTPASPPPHAEQADELGRTTCELDKLILLNYEVRVACGWLLCLRACAAASAQLVHSSLARAR